MLDQSVLDSVGASDENEATKWIYSQLDKSVKPISVFDTLKAHNGEYIYFHTDHHWTALGAYYAYREYCKLKNMTPHELTDFETMTFDGFLGTFYAKSEKSPELGANPDTVTAYIPNGTNTAETYMKDNGGWTKFTWPIVNDVSDYAKSELYATFSVGDQPLTSPTTRRSPTAPRSWWSKTPTATPLSRSWSTTMSIFTGSTSAIIKTIVPTSARRTTPSRPSPRPTVLTISFC